MATDVRLEGPELVVEFRGTDRLWTLHRGARVPLAHVTRATVLDRSEALAGVTIRIAGTYWPGAVAMGLFRARGGGRQLWSVGRARRVLVVDLVDEKWNRLVLEAPDPDAFAARLEAARGRGGS